VLCDLNFLFWMQIKAIEHQDSSLDCIVEVRTHRI
jgi:hypothetical protein